VGVARIDRDHFLAGLALERIGEPHDRGLQGIEPATIER